MITEASDDRDEITEVESGSDTGESECTDDEEWDDDDEAWYDDYEDDDDERFDGRWKKRLPGFRRKKNRQTIGDVEWMPDKDAPNCGACGKKFNLKNRRHHCRRCGAVFCGGCTKARLKFKAPEDPEDAESSGLRACNLCVAEVTIEPMFVWLSRGKVRSFSSMMARRRACSVLPLCVSANGGTLFRLRCSRRWLCQRP
eukprot:SAG11_NODE_116_length_16002_cov_19.164560_20_plen_199_part_00